MVLGEILQRVGPASPGWGPASIQTHALMALPPILVGFAAAPLLPKFKWLSDGGEVCRTPIA